MTMEATTRKAISLTLLARKQDGTLVGPRTKKNHAQIIPNLARPILAPSPEYREWERAVRRELLRNGTCIKQTLGVRWVNEPIAQPLNCQALIYRERRTGDAVGYYQAIGDVLQLFGIVQDDKFIVSWDGSRLLKDAEQPRVEITLTLIEDNLF